MNFGIILIVFFILSFFVIYLHAYTNRVNEIMNKINPKESRSFLSGIDFIELIKVSRNSKKISENERRILNNVLILCIITLILSAVYLFLVFGTDW